MASPPPDALSQVNSRSIRAPASVISLLHRLHQESMDQVAKMKKDGILEAIKNDPEIDEPERRVAAIDYVLREEFLALEPDKAVYIYNLVRASGALSVVECGTGCGVSTIYLALAVAQNVAAAGKKPAVDPRIIATEFEPFKAALARKHWLEAGDVVANTIELREGDLKQTLAYDLAQIEFVLFDVYTPKVLPALKLLENYLKDGAALIADNITSRAEGYEDYMAYINAEGSPYTTMTLPFTNGLEMTIYNAPR